MEYAIRMLATTDTYEYHIVEYTDLTISRKLVVTFKQLHDLNPKEVLNSTSALIYAQENTKYILDNLSN